MVITMNTQTKQEKTSPVDFEQEIEALKTKIASQDKELSRVSAAISEKTTALRDLLDQIYALEIDPGAKRVMTNS